MDYYGLLDLVGANNWIMDICEILHYYIGDHECLLLSWSSWFHSWDIPSLGTSNGTNSWPSHEH